MGLPRCLIPGHSSTSFFHFGAEGEICSAPAALMDAGGRTLLSLRSRSRGGRNASAPTQAMGCQRTADSDGICRPE